MRIAIVHDHLTCRAGGEQVALAFHNAFPEAPIFTLAYDSEATFPEFKTCDIRTSWFQKISIKEKNVKRFFFPLGVVAAKMLDVREFDYVLMSTTNCAKYVRLKKSAIVFCYSHNPFRLAWYPNEYVQYRNSKGLKRFIFNITLKILKLIDKKSIKNITYLITNSTTTLERHRNIYNNYYGEISIIHPPVKIENFYFKHTQKRYYLVVSRLETYKKIDLVVNVFNKLGYPLVIVGKGIMETELKQKARENISFFSDLSVEELSEVYANARALIFPQLEDFGITPLEANASGVPVIAFGEGGVLETQVYDEADIKHSTAVFFYDQTENSLCDTILKFEEKENEFDSIFIHNNPLRFSEEMFIIKIKDFIQKKLLIH